MKKKSYKSTAQSEDWGNFSSDGMGGFPNYFGETSSSPSSGNFKKK